MQVEDNLAQAFCLVGELQLSMDHCKASIQVKLLFNKPTILQVGLFLSLRKSKKQKKRWGGDLFLMLFIC